MKFLRKHYKPVIACLIILIGMELSVCYLLYVRFRERYISGDEAAVIAVEAEGFSEDEVRDIRHIFAHKKDKAWYRIRFTEGDTVYVYEVDAENGDVLSSGTE